MAADPTFASCWTQAALGIKFSNAINLFGHSTTPNLADMQDAITTAIDGVYTPAALGVIAAMRRTIASTISGSTLRDLWRPFLAEMIRAGSIDLEGSTDADLLAAVRQYMVDNDQWIKSRGMTLDTTPNAGGSNVGTGTILRCIVDKDGNPLECTGAEAKQAKVTQDAQSGARKYAEVFTFKGSLPGSDNLDVRGTGFSVEIASANPLTRNLVRNPSFDTNGVSADNTAPASLTAISGWTVNATSSFRLRSAAGYTFGGYPSQPATPYGLEFVVSGSITQVIHEQSPGVTFGNGPYLVAIRWKRLASATGTLTLALGASSVVIDVSTGVNGEWNLLYIALDEDAYFDNFNASNMALSASIPDLATGTVVVDQLVVAEMVNVDGTYYLPVSGATAWLNDDIFTWTDTDGGTRAIFSFLLWLAFGPIGWLPATADATEITAAGGRTLTFATAGDTITASTGDFGADGYKPGMLLTVAGTSSNNGVKTLTAVSALVLTVSENLTDEGPLSDTATLNATAPIAEPA